MNDGSGKNVSLTVLHQIYQLEIPWPSKQLSPNARQHWSAAAKAKKAFRARCKALGESLGLHTAKNASGAVLVDLVFYPPDRRARDLDNLLASMKAGLDGLADAMGVDDSRWQLSIKKSDTIYPGGLVAATIQIEVLQ
jgi:crossover junction endodeoxyribonuclease RusA